MVDKKRYYKITTSMLLEKTVLVPVDLVTDVDEAIQLVDNGVADCSIELLNEDAYCDNEFRGIYEMSDESARYYQIIKGD